MSKSTSPIGLATNRPVPNRNAQHNSRPLLLFEVSRGRTRFPQRPIDGRRCLIGSGAQCDVRLGGAEMPLLHSIINVSEGEIRLDVVAERPVLKVNGRVEQDVSLNDGDRIEIGPIQLIARIDRDSVSDSSRNRPRDGWANEAGRLTEAEEQPVPLSELSASDLVERIEAEEARVERWEQGRQQAAVALLQRVREQARSLMRESVTPVTGEENAPPSPQLVPVISAAGIPANQNACRIPDTDTEADRWGAELLDEMERMLRQLHEASQELEQRSARITERESIYAEAANQLLEAQQQLARQIERLISRIHSLPEEDQRPKRAIA